MHSACRYHPSPRTLAGLVLAATAPLLGTLAISPHSAAVDLSNMALMYVLIVVVMAVYFGRFAAILAAMLSALSFAYVFVPPYFSLEITEAQHLLNAVIMLAVALLVSHLTSRLKQHAESAERKSVESTKLYELAQQLAGALSREEVVDYAAMFLSRSLGAQKTRIVYADSGKADDASVSHALVEQCIKRHRFLTAPAADGRKLFYLPLSSAGGSPGALVFEAESSALENSHTVKHVETAASVLAVALERSYFVDRARKTEIEHTAETLRNSILSALSHDFRTPLTALIGMADTLLDARVSADRQQYLLESIRKQALSISEQMTNLLDMAKLTTGPQHLAKAWQAIEEVLGVTIREAGAHWPERPITVQIAADLVPVNIDAVLMERVFWNVLENAAKYSPAGTPIEVAAVRTETATEITIADSGPGIPPRQLEHLFERFARGQTESDIPGCGLGLAIARTIVEAHGGKITAENRPEGGCCFRICLPLGDLPDFDAMEATS
ncbi:MAG: DUF4118 domain-containing protein [Zoogloeaceae bacterium]|nr:DUF4118 domain-containing protein [Zoogloeaceae bacterium]